MKAARIQKVVLSLAAASVLGVTAAPASAGLITYQSMYRSWDYGLMTILDGHPIWSNSTGSASELGDIVGNFGPRDGWVFFNQWIDEWGFISPGNYVHAESNIDGLLHSRTHSDFFAFGSEVIRTLVSPHVAIWANSTCNLDFTVSAAVPYDFRFFGPNPSWLTLTSGGSTLIDVTGEFNLAGVLGPGTYSLRSGFDAPSGTVRGGGLWVEIPTPGATLLLGLSSACISSRRRHVR